MHRTRSYRTALVGAVACALLLALLLVPQVAEAAVSSSPAPR